MGSLECTQEARIALVCTSSSSYEYSLVAADSSYIGQLLRNGKRSSAGWRFQEIIKRSIEVSIDLK